MQTDEFDYMLPDELIAQKPTARRDRSRLMVLHRQTGAMEHHHFHDLPRFLKAGDLLVINETRVLPARFFARRKTGGKVEGLFLLETAPGQWEFMLRTRGKLQEEESLALDANVQLKLTKRLGDGRWVGNVTKAPPSGPAEPAATVLQRIGHTPLPPYVQCRQGEGSDDRQRYQTVYARRAGAVAAPTAGLHFTTELLDSLAEAGIDIARITLHVGAGTFRPIRTERIEDHRMHREWYEVGAVAARKIRSAKDEGRRIVAVGTTTVRTLETFTKQDGVETGWTDLYIRPGFEFQLTGAMVTNFHLPRTSLLVMISAFAGRGPLLSAYQEAIRRRYRFYSFGDAMLIL